MYFIISLVVAFVSMVIIFVKIDDIIVGMELYDPGAGAKMMAISIGFLVSLLLGMLWPASTLGALAYGVAHLIKKKLKKGEEE